MDFNYKEYEEKCIKIREDNEKYLELFQTKLIEKGLSIRTIRSHLNNVEFYINDFLLYSDAIPANEGCECVGRFLGDFFIRKCMWSTPSTIKSTATSLKKFYKCMLEYGKIDKADYEELCTRIKEDMGEWLNDCRQFNDLDQDSPFDIF